MSYELNSELSSSQLNPLKLLDNSAGHPSSSSIMSGGRRRTTSFNKNDNTVKEEEVPVSGISVTQTSDGQKVREQERERDSAL
jgi:hypothetical protein